MYYIVYSIYVYILCVCVWNNKQNTEIVPVAMDHILHCREEVVTVTSLSH